MTTEQPTFSQRGRIMQIIADHGDGNDIRTLNWLFQNVSNDPSPAEPTVNLLDLPDAPIWDCLGFDFLETMQDMCELNKGVEVSHIGFIRLLLSNQSLTERMAIVGHLLVNKLPPQLTAAVLNISK